MSFSRKRLRSLETAIATAQAKQAHDDSFGQPEKYEPLPLPLLVQMIVDKDTNRREQRAQSVYSELVHKHPLFKLLPPGVNLPVVYYAHASPRAAENRGAPLFDYGPSAIVMQGEYEIVLAIMSDIDKAPDLVDSLLNTALRVVRR